LGRRVSLVGQRQVAHAARLFHLPFHHHAQRRDGQHAQAQRRVLPAADGVRRRQRIGQGGVVALRLLGVNCTRRRLLRSSSNCFCSSCLTRICSPRAA
jgi:hypothetical protein